MGTFPEQHQTICDGSQPSDCFSSNTNLSAMEVIHPTVPWAPTYLSWKLFIRLFREQRQHISFFFGQSPSLFLWTITNCGCHCVTSNACVFDYLIIRPLLLFFRLTTLQQGKLKCDWLVTYYEPKSIAKRLLSNHRFLQTVKRWEQQHFTWAISLNMRKQCYPFQCSTSTEKKSDII